MSPLRFLPDARAHTRDALAGFLVFLVALPLSLGVAMASGFPPVAGVVTAAVGGLVTPLLGGARLTIKGPAAGLIVLVLGAVTELGAGDAALGYRRALAVGVVAAVLQIALAMARVARFGAAAPTTAVHGMLAAIGVIIVAKQAHVLMGVSPASMSPLALLAELPRSLARDNPEVLLIGGVSLALLFAWPRLGARVSALARVPGPLVALAVAIPLGVLFRFDTPHDYALFGRTFHLGPELLVTLPEHLADVLVAPDFDVVWSAASLKYVLMFAIVGSLESTLSVIAVDSLDPARRASDVDRDLLSVGVGNLLAALLGGLPMISEIIRSKANVDAGATSGRANLYHGLFLLVFVAAVPGLLHLVPLAALAAMLVYTGLRLASPHELAHVRRLGVDQVAIFAAAFVGTLAIDLLAGLALGIATKLVLHALRARGLGALLSTRVHVQESAGVLEVRVTGAATFLALPRVQAALRRGDAPSVRRVVVDLWGADLVDHSFLTRVRALADELPEATFELRGLDRLTPVAPHPDATRRLLASRSTSSAIRSAPDLAPPRDAIRRRDATHARDAMHAREALDAAAPEPDERGLGARGARR
ncbi:MAG: SulP family inorganic anion transporter [Myxococcales bacterium]|nr:SulP family inorganic anion transporter [Myxococcales bacterium]